jgi:hypothetical protein
MTAGDDMNERFLIRTEGGPCDGETRIADSQGIGGWGWPLPDVLKYDATGSYIKAAESSLPPQERGSRVLRGATYRWQLNDGAS